MCRTCLLLLTDVTAIEADLSASQQYLQTRAMRVIPLTERSPRDVPAIEADLSASQQRPQARAMQAIPPAVRVIPPAAIPPVVRVIPPAVQVIPRAAIPPAVRVIPPAVRVTCAVRVSQIWLMYQSRECSYQSRLP